jgi:hypothetical protein
MDGIVTGQELAGGEPGQSTLTVTGEDLSVLMMGTKRPFPHTRDRAHLYRFAPYLRSARASRFRPSSKLESPVKG